MGLYVVPHTGLGPDITCIVGYILKILYFLARQIDLEHIWMNFYDFFHGHRFFNQGRRWAGVWTAQIQVFWMGEVKVGGVAAVNQRPLDLDPQL